MKTVIFKIVLSRYSDLLLVSIMFFLAPFFVHDPYFLHILVISEIWVILSMSLNLIMGYTGQVSMAHGAIYGIGAYTSTLLCLKLGFSFWISLPIAMSLSMICGLLIGLPSFRATGTHFAILTLGFGLVLYDIFNNFLDLTNGPVGLTGIPPPNPVFGLTFNSKQSYYYLVFFFMFFVLYLMKRLSVSTWGRAFVAIREDEVLAKSLGINILKYKTISMTVSSGITGLAGVLYAHYILFIDPVSFTLLAGLNMVIMPVVGSMGTFIGPIIGAVLLTVLPEFLRVATGLREVIYGLMLLFFLIFLPMGIFRFLKEKITGK